MTNTIKFSQFMQGNLDGETNTLVGVTSPSGGDNFQIEFPLVWTTANRPSPVAIGVLGYNTDLSQYEYWSGSAWVQLAAGGSGSVNSGSAGELGYYEITGTAISGLLGAPTAVLLSDSSSLPVWTPAVNSSVLICTSGGVIEWSTVLPPELTPFVSGMMIDFAGNVVPTGFLACDGSAVSRTTYSSLFSAIGTIWGVGDGSTTFNLPNFSRTVAVGAGGTGTSVLGNAVGDIGGEESHTQLINELVSHTHSVGTSPDGAVLNNAGYGTFSPSGTFNTGSSGGGDPFNIIQPSAVVLKIIKT